MKKGITLVSVLATVAIIIILATTITISGINISNNAKKMAFANELNALQQSVDTYVINNNGEYPTQYDILLDTSNLSQNAKKQFADNGETINENNKLQLSAIDYNKINNNNLKYGKKVDGDNDIYAISLKTGKVYYAKGLKVGSDVYFTLTQSLKNILGYNSQKDTVVTANAIIFEPSETNWTNSDITVKIKVPKNYIVTSITAKDIALTATSTDQSYNIYQANQSGNYTIIVKYKENANSAEKTSKYIVDKVDKVAPTFTVSALNNLPSNNSIGYINITAKADDSSGIKKILYEDDKIDTNIKEYFSTVTNEIKDDTIIIKKGVSKITVYVEDNAGNFSYKNIDI